MPPADPRVLFLAPVEPWCRENGSSVIIADLLDGLTTRSTAHELRVFLRRPPDGCRPHEPLGDRGIQLGLRTIPRWLSIVQALAMRSTPIRLRFDNRAVAEEVIRTVRGASFAPEVIHVEHLPLVDIGIAVAREFGAPLVYRAHNIEAQLLERRMTFRGPLANGLLRYMIRAEREAIEACDLTLCISDLDLEWVRRHAPQASARFFACALRLDRYDAFAAEPKAAVPQIGFAGGLDWAPNERGLRWFMEEVFPLIVQRVPTVKLAVVARSASDRPWLASHPSVEIMDHRADVRTLFARSWVSVAPLLQGGGVRIKIPESLALGCPVVSTSIGAEGHDLPGLSRADEPDAFARACAAALQTIPTRADYARLRAAVEARHGATVLAAQLLEAWQQVLAGRQAA
jgi:polysaccharide biosynthesis protein PslH